MNYKTFLRNYIRLEKNYDLTYKFLDSDPTYNGSCSSLSSSGIYFSTNQQIDTGIALEIHMPSQSISSPSMTAFIEVVQSTKLRRKLFEIYGTIKSIKAN